jgi:hypothetical protein
MSPSSENDGTGIERDRAFLPGFFQKVLSSSRDSCSSKDKPLDGDVALGEQRYPGSCPQIGSLWSPPEMTFTLPVDVLAWVQAGVATGH